MRRRTLGAPAGFLMLISLIAGCAEQAEQPEPPPSSEAAVPAPPLATETDPDTTEPPAPAVEDPGIESPEAEAAPAQSAPAAPVPPPAATPATPASDPALIEAGRQVFAGPGQCYACHGPAAQGTALAPNLTDGSWIWITDPQQDLRAKLATLIRAGVPSPREHPAPMPAASGLNDEQLQAVAAYVVSLSQ